MPRGWYGLEVGDEVIYQGHRGKITELFVRDKNSGLMVTEDGREFIVICELCKKIEKDSAQWCPFCAYEGIKVELFEKGTLKRCIRCIRDFPTTNHGNKVTEKPIKGMKAILG